MWAGLLACIWMFVSCDKQAPQVDNESQCAADNAQASQEFTSLVPAIFRHMSATPGAKAPKGFSGGCRPFVYVQGDTTDFDPAPSFTIDASELSASMADGRSRKGQITVRLAAPFAAENGDCSVSLDYRADDWQMNAGSFNIRGKGSNDSYYAFQADVAPGTISMGSQTFTYAASHTLSFYPARNYYTFYGKSSGTSINGQPYTAEVKKDIGKSMACAWFDAGILLLAPRDFKERTIYFGDGTCDNKASYAVSQNTVAFKLK